MLTPELVQALQAPVTDASPCGEDLEYDAAFMALASSAQGKAEQQFGDTVIAAVEPDWRVVAQQAQALLRRTKDVRVGVLLLRATTRLQGVAGFTLGLRLLHGLLDAYWDSIHPQLDADDGNDPTMRLNALAPLGDEGMVPRDLYDATVGTAHGIGLLRVRDIAIARNALFAVGGELARSPAEVQGGLEEILASDPAMARTLSEVLPLVEQLQTLLEERTGRAGVADLARLRVAGQALVQAGKAAAGTSPSPETPTTANTHLFAGDDEPPREHVPARGDIHNRQDALQMLDRVMRYLEQVEPGNPAPLLIGRAKQLIGVSFFEIMDNLAPNALDTIETVTGKRPSG